MEDPKYVFTAISKGVAGNPLDEQYLYDLVRRLSKRAGIKKVVNFQVLRHTFASDLYRETKNIRLVQKALGHSQLQTTMIYTHVIDEEIEDRESSPNTYLGSFSLSRIHYHNY